MTTATNETDNNQSITDLVTNDDHNDDRRDNVDKIKSRDYKLEALI